MCLACGGAGGNGIARCQGPVVTEKCQNFQTWIFFAMAPRKGSKRPARPIDAESTCLRNRPSRHGVERGQRGLFFIFCFSSFAFRFSLFAFCFSLSAFRFMSPLQKACRVFNPEPRTAVEPTCAGLNRRAAGKTGDSRI